MRNCIKREMQQEIILEISSDILIRAKRLAKINEELMELGLNPYIVFTYEDKYCDCINKNECTCETECIEIHNPFYDKYEEKEVDPIEYYGNAFLESRFVELN